MHSADYRSKLSDIASLYIEDCLNKLSVTDRDKGQTLLRYVALWGAFALNPNTEDQPQATFLKAQGIDERGLRAAIEKLVSTGILRNWGIEKRAFCRPTG